MKDQQIFEGLYHNDRATVQWVYKNLSPALFKYVLNNSGDRDDARDLFQEAFIKVLGRIQNGQYSHRDKFEAYFFTIARNTWIDILRRRKHHSSVSNSEDILLQRADDNDEDALAELLVQDQRMGALQRVWAAWSDTDCRRILQRFHYDNARTKDIAEEEGIAQNALLQRLFKCRNKLFKMVSQQVASA